MGDETLGPIRKNNAALRRKARRDEYFYKELCAFA